LSCKTRVKKRYQSKVRFDLDQQQREYFLHQQMKTIQEELGGNTQEDDEMLVKAKDKMG
jgi:ATP-dependent Lon protease